MASIAILGATGSIGSTLARRLVGAGRSVLLLARNRDKLASLSAELDQPSAVIDLKDSRALEELLQQQAGSCGGFASIINCIGSIFLKPAHATADEDFRNVLETNLFTAFATVRAGAEILRRDGGAILLFASAAAEIGIRNHEAIAAAKGGVSGLVRAAAAGYAQHNIRVNAISPGLVRTDMTRSMWENAVVAAASERMHALGRLGEPGHVASLAAWLLEPENDWITGQVIGVDGGLSRVLAKR